MKYTETYYKVLLHIHFIVCKIRPAWHNYRMQDNHSCVTHSVREKHVYILDGCGSNRQSSSWFNLDTSWMGSQEWVMGLGLGGFLIYNVFRFLNPVYKVIKGSSPKSENSFTIYSPSCPKCEWIFLLQNTEDDILKNVAPIYFHWMDTKKQSYTRPQACMTILTELSLQHSPQKPQMTVPYLKPPVRELYSDLHFSSGV